MNYRIVSYVVGRILQIEAAIFMLPMLVSVIYLGADGDKAPRAIFAFAVSAAISLAAGLFLTYVLFRLEI